MKTIIETLQSLITRINTVERFSNDDYVITINDKKLITEALNQALHLHSIMQAEGSDGAKEAAVGQRSEDTVAESWDCHDNICVWSSTVGEKLAACEKKCARKSSEGQL